MPRTGLDGAPLTAQFQSPVDRHELQSLSRARRAFLEGESNLELMKAGREIQSSSITSSSRE